MDKIDEIAEIAVLGGVGFNSHRDCENYPVRLPMGCYCIYYPHKWKRYCNNSQTR